MADSTTARSPMQEAFAADVSVATADVGLYLVVASGDGEEMYRALDAVGAAIAARISAHRVLAVMRYPSFEVLRGERAIGLVGPVNLDPARFELFQRLIGLGATE